MTLTYKQTQALDILEDYTTTELLFGGGAGGGKSAFGCYWQIRRRLKYPGTRGLIGRSKLKVLKDTTLKSFIEVAEMQGLYQGTHYKITSSHDRENPNCIVFYNSSIIYLRDLFLYPSDPDFDDLGSLEITDAFIDECNQIVESGKGIVKSRIRFKLDENGLMPKILMTCNPAKNWTYRQFYKPSTNNTLPIYRKFIQSLLSDNPNVSKHYRDNLLTLSKNSMERLLYGNWSYDSDPATLIDADAITDYFNPNHITKGTDKYMTIDVARKGKDKTVFRIWEGWLCTYRYEFLKGALTEVVRLAKTYQQKHGVSNSNTIADEDGVGGGVVDFLGCKGFINNSTPIKEMITNKTVTPNYTNLKSQCSIRMANKIQNREVGELCDNQSVIDLVSEEMEQVKMKDIDKDGKVSIVPKDLMKEKVGRSPDDWDSIMMRYYFALSIDVFTF
jgi:phage terminase large subunit